MHATSLSGWLPFTEWVQDTRNDSAVNEAYLVRDYWLEIYHNPLSNLSLRAQEKLIQECMPVVQSGFGQQSVDEEVVRRHFLATSTTLVIRNESDQVVGVSGSSIISIDEYRIIYFQGATISQECRAQGLHKLAAAVRIIAEVKKIDQDCVKKNQVLLGGRTQNPLVYKFMHRQLGMFPYPNGYIDEEIKSISRKFAQQIYDNYSDCQSSYGLIFDYDVSVSRKSLVTISNSKEICVNIYGNSIPFCKNDDEINNYMKENIKWNNGDALIMLGYYSSRYITALFHNKKIGDNTAVDVGYLPVLELSNA